VPDNVAMLRNLIDAIEPVARGLEHVHLVQGTKYYGMHLGPFRTPAREDDPRPDFPNFYYDQQDLLAERARGKPGPGRPRARRSSMISRRSAPATASP
jgi:hypothetical protein